MAARHAISSILTRGGAHRTLQRIRSFLELDSHDDRALRRLLHRELASQLGRFVLVELPRLALGSPLGSSEAALALAESSIEAGNEIEDRLDWIDIIFVDLSGDPMPGVKCKITTSAGTTRHEVANSQGQIYCGNIPASAASQIKVLVLSP